MSSRLPLIARPSLSYTTYITCDHARQWQEAPIVQARQAQVIARLYCLSFSSLSYAWFNKWLWQIGQHAHQLLSDKCFLHFVVWLLRRWYQLRVGRFVTWRSCCIHFLLTGFRFYCLRTYFWVSALRSGGRELVLRLSTVSMYIYQDLSVFGAA